PLTMEIISILENSQDKKAVTYLASLLRFKKKSILLRTIEAIGKYKNPKSNRILLPFLDDPDKDIRIRSARNIPLPQEKEIQEEIIKRVRQKSFLKKTPEEKAILIDLLAAAGSKESLAVLKDIIKSVGFLAKRRKKETGLYAVSSIKRTKNPLAQNILEEGKKSRNKAIREACRKAITDKIAFSSPGSA
ncbi:MAG: hypothetical protein ACOC57_07095, partial [Acidobacteriota bacterium]